MSLPGRGVDLSRAGLILIEVKCTVQIGGKTVTVKNPCLLAGMSCVAMGMTLYVHAGSGAEPWSLFYAGVSMASGLPLGTVVQLTGVVMVATVCLAAVLPGPGTVGSFVVLVFSNLFAKLDFSWLGTGLWWKCWLGRRQRSCSLAWVYTSRRIWAKAVLNWFSSFGAEAETESGYRKDYYGWDRIIGRFLPGRPLGVGTVCSALCIGPLLDFFSRLSRRYIFNER